MYAIVLVVATVVTLTGLASIQISRSRSAGSAVVSLRRDAAVLAASGTELALLAMQDANWRSSHLHDIEVPERELGPGTISYKFVDLIDTDLGNDDTHDVMIVGIGRIGTTTFLQSVKAGPSASLIPMDFLSMAAHTQNQILIEGSQAVAAAGAPLSTNNSCVNHGVLYGDLEATSRGGSGSVTGTATVPASVKPLPPASVIDDYIQTATVLAHVGDIDKVVIAPGVNQYGGDLNPDGCYYINTGGSDLTIKLSRVLGTLIVDTGGGRVYLDTNISVQNYRPDYPALLVRGGDVYLQYFSRDSDPSKRHLSEGQVGHNFNPPGAPYLGSTDSDTGDNYPSDVRGLVHVIGNVRVFNAPEVRGCLVATGDIVIDAMTDYEAQFIHDPNLLTNPPQGYTIDSGTITTVIDTTSWRREVIP